MYRINICLLFSLSVSTDWLVDWYQIFLGTSCIFLYFNHFKGKLASIHKIKRPVFYIMNPHILINDE